MLHSGEHYLILSTSYLVILCLYLSNARDVCAVKSWGGGCKFFEVEMKSDLHYKIGRAKIKIRGTEWLSAFSLTIYHTVVEV